MGDVATEDQRAELKRDGGATRSPTATMIGTVYHHAQLIEDGRAHCLLHRSIEVRCPMRMLHGTADVDVPWQFFSAGIAAGGKG